ncbi:MAG TPA: VOC family protein [Alphaproteobacteria bacterium]|nr:VOC family protein [Alphaproteobacteria bacterium]
MPSLENLKKQAKLVLRWHRTGYHPVAAQIRAVLPRYQGLTDAEILALPFRLVDAQELVARQAGFAGWAALREGLVDMPKRAPSTSPEPRLAAAEPQLFTLDLKAACAFYAEKLGFTVAFAYGDPPFYGQVVRDGARLNLRQVDRPVLDGARCAREDLLSASLILDSPGGVKALFAACQFAGVPFHQTLRLEPWGARTFIVRDPDGNLLLFAGPVDEAGQASRR